MSIITYNYKILLTLFKKSSYSIFRKVGIDRAVFWGILGRLWNIISGPVSILLIVSKFSPQLQGYYYTFLSVIGFQVLIELGLNTNVIQFASHEWAKLSLDAAGQIKGDKEALSRLQSLAQFFFRWYCMASIVLTLGLGIGGYIFFSKNQDVNINWALPWFILCVCNGLIFCLVPIWALLEGCNQVLELYFYRFIQGMFLSLSIWIAILSGAKLWTVAISNIVVLICSWFFLKNKYKTFFKTLLFSRPMNCCIEWYREIFPLQWRTSLTWLVGSFTFTLFTPVLFKYHGSVTAGQMGMTWSLVSVLLTITFSWLSPKIPQFGILIAKKKYEELDRLFWRTTKIIISVAITGAVIAWGIIYILNEIRHPFAARFLAPLPSGIFLLAQVILITSLSFSSYLRAHKKEPLLYVSISSGIMTILSTLILGRYYSALGMAFGYLATNLILVPIVIFIWHRCRASWHGYKYSNIEIEKALA